jgi:hypothetical protein
MIWNGDLDVFTANKRRAFNNESASHELKWLSIDCFYAPKKNRTLCKSIRFDLFDHLRLKPVRFNTWLVQHQI